MDRYEVLVVGGGPAGITLAKMLGRQKKMAVIRPEDHSMIYCAMPYALEGRIEWEKTLKKDELVTASGCELIRDTVSEIDFMEKQVTLSGSKLAYEKLVLATGAVPFIPPIPGNELQGVTGFKTENDLRNIESMIASGFKTAVVVGAGAIGIELAQALQEAGLQVDLVDLGTSILPNLVDPEMTPALEAEIASKGINLHLGSKVTSLTGKEWVESVFLESGEVISFGGLKGLVIFAAGMKPVIHLAENSGIEIGHDGIKINEKLETNMKDVYAVGDCTQYISGITGSAVPGKLATNAVPMAKVLGFNLLGQNRNYPGFYNGAATKVGKYYVGGTGLSERTAESAGFDTITGYSEVTTQFPIMPEAKELRFKMIAEKETGRILGAQVVSGEPVTGTIDLMTFAIQKKTTVEEMTSLSYSSQPYQSFFPAANGVVLASEEILKKMRLT